MLKHLPAVLHFQAAPGMVLVLYERPSPGCAACFAAAALLRKARSYPYSF
jgi:hypothetical protein